MLSPVNGWFAYLVNCSWRPSLRLLVREESFTCSASKAGLSSGATSSSGVSLTAADIVHRPSMRAISNVTCIVFRKRSVPDNVRSSAGWES